MKVVLEKIHRCNLSVNEEMISQVGDGLLVFVGVHREDTRTDADYLANKIVNLRMFKDDQDKLNKSVLDIGGDVLVVSNFTLQGELISGTRQNFSKCADHESANNLYLYLADKIRELGVKNVKLGKFAQHMHLDTMIDGPMLIILDSKKQIVRD